MENKELYIMKRFTALLLVCALLLLSLTACAVKEKVDLAYGEKYQVQNEILEKYEWSIVK